MNIRKNIDYSEMYESLDKLMVQQLPQMELYCEIGKAVSSRTEKGAAVAAAEYLAKKYPDVQGFSPRNLRRMRNFNRAYEDQRALLSLALQLGWTQNIVILEGNLSMELRGWYLKAVKQFGWSKAELTEKIATNAHEMIVLAIDEEACNTDEQEEAVNQNKVGGFLRKDIKIRHLIQKVRCRVYPKKEGGRRWPSMLCQKYTEKRIVFMRC
ncbi:MAG: DUF1016 N-terminal domain-containing protein [Agathobacter sp.]